MSTPHQVGLFVDTQNLYYSARDYHSAHVNYATLRDLALAVPQGGRARELRVASAYIVERGEAAKGFAAKLNSLGYRVQRRQVSEYRTEEGHVVLEGDWDMGIAADIVRAWDYLDVIVLASGDGDFVPILRLAQERGCRVEVLALRQSTSQRLLDIADAFTEMSAVGNALM